MHRLLAALASAAILVAPASPVAAATDSDFSVSVVDGHGRPFATDILVFVMPTSLEQLQADERTEARVVHTNGRGKADLGGVLTSGDRSKAKANGNWTHLSVVALDADGRPGKPKSVTRYLGTDGAQLSMAKSQKMSGTTTLRVRRTTATPTATATAQAITPDAISCYSWYWETYRTGFSDQRVGELHADSNYTMAKFTYGQTADSTFDVMYKQSGTNWYASGGVHVSNSESQASAIDARVVTASNYHSAMNASFNYARLRLYRDCLDVQHDFYGHEQIVMLDWRGGLVRGTTITQGTRNANYSITLGGGGEWSRSSTKLTKWTGGANAFGVTFGVSSGASSNVRYDYKFGSLATHWLYGNTGLPRDSLRVYQDTP